MLACKGLKLLWIQKQYIALSLHTRKQKKEKSDPPFAKVKNIIHT